jgi:hypothetical protein
MEVSGQLHSSAALPPGKKSPVTIGVWVDAQININYILHGCVTYQMPLLRSLPPPPREGYLRVWTLELLTLLTAANTSLDSKHKPSYTPPRFVLYSTVWRDQLRRLCSYFMILYQLLMFCMNMFRGGCCRKCSWPILCVLCRHLPEYTDGYCW